MLVVGRSSCQHQCDPFALAPVGRIFFANAARAQSISLPDSPHPRPPPNPNHRRKHHPDEHSQERPHADRDRPGLDGCRQVAADASSSGTGDRRAMCTYSRARMLWCYVLVMECPEPAEHDPGDQADAKHEIAQLASQGPLLSSTERHNSHIGSKSKYPQQPGGFSDERRTGELARLCAIAASISAPT